MDLAMELLPAFVQVGRVEPSVVGLEPWVISAIGFKVELLVKLVESVVQVELIIRPLEP